MSQRTSPAHWAERLLYGERNWIRREPARAELQGDRSRPLQTVREKNVHLILSGKLRSPAREGDGEGGPRGGRGNGGSSRATDSGPVHTEIHLIGRGTQVDRRGGNRAVCVEGKDLFHGL